MSAGHTAVLVASVLVLGGCVHYWGGTRQGEVRFSDFMSALGPDVPIQLVVDSAGEAKHQYPVDDYFDAYLFHLIENSAWDGIPGPTAEAGVVLLVERESGRVRDAKVTFERAHSYPGWQAFMASLAAGSYRSRSISCSGNTTSFGYTASTSVFCTGW
jgi:hypothetical protein